MDQQETAVNHTAIQSKGAQAWQRHCHMSQGQPGHQGRRRKKKKQETVDRKHGRGGVMRMVRGEILPGYRAADRWDQGELNEPPLTCPAGVSRT